MEKENSFLDKRRKKQGGEKKSEGEEVQSEQVREKKETAGLRTKVCWASYFQLQHATTIILIHRFLDFFHSDREVKAFGSEVS